MNYLQITNLTKSYGETIILDNVNLSIDSGEIVGLLGRNGAGKSTLMKCIVGLVRKDYGKIKFNGVVSNKFGYLIEYPAFYPNLSAYDNLKIFASILNVCDKRIKDIIDIVGLTKHGDKIFANYSLGMKQRLGIANAILHDPEVLILDEPTNGLDPIGIAEVRDFIKDLSVKKGKTILISSHILSEITLLADTVGIIDKGVLLEENSMEELNKKNRKYIILEVSDVSKAATILEKEFGITNYSVEDNNHIRIYSHGLDMAKINKSLVMNEISVISSQICNDSLEDYFKKITGGEGIA